jgi:hypothetical protein
MWVAVLLVLSASGAAEGKAAQADKLFSEGRKLSEEQRWGEACKAFERSYELDQALGTLLNMANCYEKAGRTTSAWASFNEAASWARRSREWEREKVARERAAALEHALSRLRVEAGSGTRVTLDGIPLVALDSAVDPGTHVVRASAAGSKPWSQSVEVPPGPALTTVAVPPLEADPLGADPAPAAATAVPFPGAQVTAEAPLFDSRTRNAGKVGVAIGATLIAAAAAGIVYSLRVNQLVQRQQPGGPDYNHPTVTRDQFQTLSWLYPLSWEAAGLGAISLSGGAALIAWSPASPSVVPSAPVAGATVRGQF